MDGGVEDTETNYLSRLKVVTEGEWAGWSYYPGGDPYEDLAGPFYCRVDEQGRRVSAFRAEKKHMNGGMFMHGGCVMTFADFCLFWIARDDLADSRAVTATFNGEFVGTARIGELVECTGEVVKAGRSMVFVRGIISNASQGGEPMMSFSAVLKNPPLVIRAAILAAGILLALPVATQARPMFQPWIDGTAASEPQTQTQRVGRDTYVIRQSVKTNFEAPFLYLLFGKDRALLVDTGAGGLKIRPAVDAAITEWLAEHHRASIPLVLAHSHSHGDHRTGDAEFKDRPDTTIVGWTAPEVAAFFKIADWPNNVATFDLGGRALAVIPTPGHHPSHIMIFDPATRWLISGDTLYPGRLYIPDGAFADYRASLDRVVAATRSRRVSHVMGAHIEMTREAGKDYPQSAPAHPNEHLLELPYADLLELQAAVHAMGDTPKRDAHPDFIVFPLPPRPKP